MDHDPSRPSGHQNDSSHLISADAMPFSVQKDSRQEQTHNRSGTDNARTRDGVTHLVLELVENGSKWIEILMKSCSSFACFGLAVGRSLKENKRGLRVQHLSAYEVQKIRNIIGDQTGSFS